MNIDEQLSAFFRKTMFERFNEFNRFKVSSQKSKIKGGSVILRRNFSISWRQRRQEKRLLSAQLLVIFLCNNNSNSIDHNQLDKKQEKIGNFDDRSESLIESLIKSEILTVSCNIFCFNFDHLSMLVLTGVVQQYMLPIFVAPCCSHSSCYL